MSKKEVYTCDRCGKEMYLFTNKFNFATIHLYQPYARRSGAFERIDLCESCFQDFVSFMGNENISIRD